MATFLSLYSGSSGNCALVGEADRYLCIDMGKSCRATVGAMNQLGIDPAQLQGILITHEHSDHVSGLKVFLKKYAVPVFGSEATLAYLAGHDMVPPTARLEVLDEGGQSVGQFAVRSFHTSHDAVDCRGYRITAPSGHTAAMATDLGQVTEEVIEGLSGADLTVLEANYDPVRLRLGPYPDYLKTRIASPKGHLSNADAGDALARLLGEGCEKFALCHLSQENNTPQLALQAVSGRFLAAGALPGRDGLLQALSRSGVSPKIDF